MDDEPEDKIPSKPEKYMTPEEKLFRLIANKYEVHEEESAEVPLEVKKKKWEIKLPEWVDSALSPIKDFLNSAENGLRKVLPKRKDTAWKDRYKREKELQAFNQVLLALIVAAFLYLVVDIIVVSVRNSSENSYQSEEIQRGTSLIPEIPEQVKEPLSRYLEAHQQRNIFLPKIKEVPKDQEEAASIRPEDFKLKLVGISWDEDGYVAMIEVGEAGKAQFVRAGHQFGDRVKVDEVKEYTVVLSRDGQTWELN